ncbi:hypothetical protein [Nitrobacter hamburgensis]|nr:hypothetical protein [Nitrobacter hamburgensis]
MLDENCVVAVSSRKRDLTPARTNSFLQADALAAGVQSRCAWAAVATFRRWCHRPHPFYWSDAAPREIDYAHPGERAIFDEMRSEGLVLFSRDISWSGVEERQIVAVVAAAEGPALVCARSWPPLTGDGMIIRIDLRCRVEDACRLFLSADGIPAARPLVPHTDAGIVAKYRGATAIWRQGIAGDLIQTVYLLRIRRSTGPELVVASDTVTGGRSEVVEHGRVETGRLREWAAEIFGADRLSFAP